MSSDDVEISTWLRPGEWTQESLDELLREYQHKIAEDGRSARRGQDSC